MYYFLRCVSLVFGFLAMGLTAFMLPKACTYANVGETLWSPWKQLVAGFVMAAISGLIWWCARLGAKKLRPPQPPPR